MYMACPGLGMLGYTYSDTLLLREHFCLYEKKMVFRVINLSVLILILGPHLGCFPGFIFLDGFFCHYYITHTVRKRVCYVLSTNPVPYGK